MEEFYNYLEKSGFTKEMISLITEEEKSMLYKMFLDYKKLCDIEKETFERALNSKSEVDYTSDINKISMKRMESGELLNEQIKLIKESYGFAHKTI